MKRALITGINGFVGAHLSALLQARGYAVSGIDRWDTCPVRGVAYASVDILDRSAVAAAFAEHQPDEVYHLAGISYLPEADASPGLALQINIHGTVTILDAVKNVTPSAVVLFAGSSKEYSNETSADMIDESAHPSPTDFYGISKYAAEMICLQYVRQFGLDVRVSRSFNHTGPGQPPRFVCPDWAKQAAEIAAGARPPKISVGNLDAQIDFSDVRDVVAAYHAIATRGRKGEVYNVCSGRCVSLRFILERLTSKVMRPVEVESATGRQRAHKTSPRLVGSHAKLTEHTGWEPRIAFEQTLDDIYDYWVEQGKAAGAGGQGG